MGRREGPAGQLEATQYGGREGGGGRWELAESKIAPLAGSDEWALVRIYPNAQKRPLVSNNTPFRVQFFNVNDLEFNMRMLEGQKTMRVNEGSSGDETYFSSPHFSQCLFKNGQNIWRNILQLFVGEAKGFAKYPISIVQKPLLGQLREIWHLILRLSKVFISKLVVNFPFLNLAKT